jgi:hypothetical protein
MDVIPFRHTVNPNFNDNGFLFSNGKRGFWDTELRSSYTKRWASYECNTSCFRHIAKAFDREFIRGKEAVNNDDDDDYAIEDELAAHDLMQGHSIKVAGLRYGLNSELMQGLTAHTIDTLREVSDRWQNWYKLAPRLTSSGLTDFG